MKKSKRLVLASRTIDAYTITASTLAFHERLRNVQVVRYPLIGTAQTHVSFGALAKTTVLATRVLCAADPEADLGIMVAEERISEKDGRRRREYSATVLAGCSARGVIVLYSGLGWVPSDKEEALFREAKKVFRSLGIPTETDAELIEIASVVGSILMDRLSVSTQEDEIVTLQ